MIPISTQRSDTALTWQTQVNKNTTSQSILSTTGTNDLTSIMELTTPGFSQQYVNLSTVPTHGGIMVGIFEGICLSIRDLESI